MTTTQQNTGNVEIKGQCENCGEGFKGKVSQGYIDKNEGSVRHTCGQLTQNWDEAYVVDALNKEEGTQIEYKEVVFN